LQQIKPAIMATIFEGERTGSSPAVVDAVAEQNVLLTLEAIRKNGPVLDVREKEGKIKIAGAMYNLSNGEVVFLN